MFESKKILSSKNLSLKDVGSNSSNRSLVQNFWVKKEFRTTNKKYSPIQKKLVKKCWPKKIFGQQKNWSKNYLSQKKLVQTKFWATKIKAPKNWAILIYGQMSPGQMLPMTNGIFSETYLWTFRQNWVSNNCDITDIECVWGVGGVVCKFTFRSNPT